MVLQHGDTIKNVNVNWYNRSAYDIGNRWRWYKSIPIAKASLELLNVDSAQELGHVVAAVGLAQNFASMFALVSEGIQQGHIDLQYKSLAIVVGAKGDEIAQVAEALKQSPSECTSS